MSAITNAKNINMLLEAAAILDNRERKSSLSDLSDHYYASNSSSSERKTKSNKHVGQRLSHNQSEKVRRAHLRSALDELKSELLANVGTELNRHTAVGLFNTAFALIQVSLIWLGSAVITLIVLIYFMLMAMHREVWIDILKNLKEIRRKLWMEKHDLEMEKTKLVNRYMQLFAGSECSTQTDSGTSKESSENSFYWEQDDIDIVGDDLDENWQRSIELKANEDDRICDMSRFSISGIS